MSATATPCRSFPLATVCVLTGALFAAAYGQAPLYYSNQNQYFLHGLAQAGVGHLQEDWLANTLDPTPVFSGLVELTARWLHPWAFHVLHAILLGVYAAALVALFAWLVGPEVAARRWPWFVLLLIILHSAAARWASYRLFGQDFPWYFQSGLAGQYVLGGMLQPSVFGVLLLAAVALFVRGHAVLAGISCAAACTLHATYLLPAALLTLGFCTALALEKRWRTALRLGSLTLLLVLPITLFSLRNFGPSTPEQFNLAQDILANMRIPHHCRVDLWLDPIAGLQIAWMALGVALCWGTRLFPVLAVAFALATLLTILQALSGSDYFALLFPWRISAILMPLATGVIFARLINWFPRKKKDPQISQISQIGKSDNLNLCHLRNLWICLFLVFLGVAGIGISVGRFAFHTATDEERLYDAVRQHLNPGQVYLLPVRIPDLAKTTRGSLSSDFKPVAQRRTDQRIIPVDLQRFRLHTGAAIFVDFKSIPYKDVEVIAWRDRLLWAAQVHEQIRQGKAAEAAAALGEKGITHLVLPANQPFQQDGWKEVHKDDHYQIVARTKEK